MIQTSSRTELIESVKLRQLLAASRLGIASSSLLAVVLAYELREQITDTVLIVWLFSVLLIAIFRVVWISTVQKTHSDLDGSQVHLRLAQFRIAALIAGIVWGAAGYFLLPTHSLGHVMLLMFMLVGLSSGGLVAYSVDFISASLYITATLVPAAISLLFTEFQHSALMSFSMLAYLWFLMITLRHLSSQSIDNILLRIDGDLKDSSIKAGKVGEDRYHLILDHLPIGVFYFNKNNVVTFCNQQLGEILKGSPYFSEGANLYYLSNREIKANLEATLSDAQVSRYEGIYDNGINNSEQWISMLCAPVINSEDEVTEGIGIVQDITERKRAAKLVERFALQDYLTELPNRRMLIDKIQQALDSNAESHKDVALLYIDLDNFKDLNDEHGHAVGDLLLQQVAKRLLNCLRPKDMVARAARIGGDEFVILLENLSTEHDEATNQAGVVGNKILTKLNQPFKLSKHEYQCAVSIGIALYNAGGGSVDDLLRHADIAMYEAKKAGNAVRFYNIDMLEMINQRDSMKRALRSAIQKQEFQLYYQIQVDAKQKPIGAEALIRWNRPNHGLVPPLDFIPLAEETGLIVPIGIWALNNACNQLSQWAKKPKMRRLTIAINVSVKQLMEPDFAAEVNSSIKKYKINPALLKIEVTESMFLENAPEVIDTMTGLQKLGVGFELDDFGTGYSCLQYLKQLPLKQLKIDQSFVRDINKDKSDQSIVKTIIAMAEGFNINVIAEGVEANEQYSLLSSYGCQHFQGYYFGKPMPVDAFEAALNQAKITKVEAISE